jgi:hypothetical protein
MMVLAMINAIVALGSLGYLVLDMYIKDVQPYLEDNDEVSS